MTILDEIAEYAKLRVTEDKKICSLEEMRQKALAVVAESDIGDPGGRGQSVISDPLTPSPRVTPITPGLYAFGQALKKPGLSIISEVKKASPSKGIIAEDFPYVDIAKSYEEAGADCVSCLTEPKWFLGSDKIFTEIRENISIPMIRKDFTIDEYQIYQAKVMGANAVLLICALLPTETIINYLQICDELKLDALVETHDAAEIESAVKAGARIIGVNNRNLKDFSVNFENAKELRSLIPSDSIYVAESGVKGPEDVDILRAIGADAVLCGEALMRSSDKKAMIKAFKGN